MTTLTQPIAKLYKRCARNHHDQCPGSFETWSVCSCDCHADVSDERPAPNTYAPFCKICQRNVPCEHLPAITTMPVTCADKAPAVDAAEEWIAQHAEIAHANALAVAEVTTPTVNIDGAVDLGFRGTHRGPDGSLNQWTQHFHMCAEHATTTAILTFTDSIKQEQSRQAANYVNTCDSCRAATKQAMRDYANSPAYIASFAKIYEGYNGGKFDRNASTKRPPSWKEGK